MEEPEPFPQILSPCSSGRRSSDSKSPEFEFWMVRNPSFPQPDLHSADELFSGGFLLPLHHLHLANDPPPPQDPSQSSESGQTLKPDANPADLSAAPALTSSKRWTDIFKKSVNVNGDDRSSKEKCTSVKEKKREKNGGSGAGNGVSAAELNINLWPFSRSRSAGNGGTRPRSAAATRKVSSAPCSRSNSAGESKSRKWPSSPGRGAGVHLGRSSPVWQVRRSAAAGGGGRSSDGKVKSAEKRVKNDRNEGHRKIPAAPRGGGGSKTRVLSFNVPMCIGYRHHLSCRSDENSAVSIAAAAAGGGGQNAGGVAGEGAGGSNFFNIKGLFSKKVY